MAKEKRKNMLTRDQMKEFIKDNEIQSVDDIQIVLKDLFAETLQGMQEAEMDSHLGYEKMMNRIKSLITGEMVTVQKWLEAIMVKLISTFQEIETVTLPLLS